MIRAPDIGNITGSNPVRPRQHPQGGIELGKTIKRDPVGRLARGLQDSIEFRIIELAKTGPRDQYAFDSIVWAEDADGNKYWEVFGCCTDTPGRHITYREIQIQALAMARWLAEVMIEMELSQYNYRMDTKGHMRQWDPEKDKGPLKVTKVHQYKPKDWPDMNEPPDFKHNWGDKIGSS